MLDVQIHRDHINNRMTAALTKWLQRTQEVRPQAFPLQDVPEVWTIRLCRGNPPHRSSCQVKSGMTNQTL